MFGDKLNKGHNCKSWAAPATVKWTTSKCHWETEKTMKDETEPGDLPNKIGGTTVFYILLLGDG